MSSSGCCYAGSGQGSGPSPSIQPGPCLPAPGHHWGATPSLVGAPRLQLAFKLQRAGRRIRVPAGHQVTAPEPVGAGPVRPVVVEGVVPRIRVGPAPASRHPRRNAAIQARVGLARPAAGAPCRLK
jgi:hypothetical protein